MVASRSAGSFLNQSMVSRAVTAKGRKARPAATAVATLVSAIAPIGEPGGNQTGMSRQGRTCCEVRNSVSAEVNLISLLPLVTARQPCSISANEGRVLGPVAL